MSELINYYREILTAVGCVINEEDKIFYVAPNSKEEVLLTPKINGHRKSLVLPTQEILRNGNWDEIVAFHPFCESILLGQSEILNLYTLFVADKIYVTTQGLLASIITLALDPKAQKKLSMDQVAIINKFDITDAVQTLAKAVADKCTNTTGKHPLLSIRLDRGGELNHEKFSRTCKLITHVINTENPCGVTSGGIGARATLKALYEYILPTKLHVGSNSTVAPYFTALLECFYQAAIHLNVIVESLGVHTPVETINVAWHDNIKLIPSLAKLLPQTLEGNKGLVIKEKNNGVSEDTIESVTPNNDLNLVKANKKSPDAVASTNNLGLRPLEEVIKQYPQNNSYPPQQQQQYPYPPQGYPQNNPYPQVNQQQYPPQQQFQRENSTSTLSKLFTTQNNSHVSHMTHQNNSHVYDAHQQQYQYVPPNNGYPYPSQNNGLNPLPMYSNYR